MSAVAPAAAVAAVVALLVVAGVRAVLDTPYLAVVLLVLGAVVVAAWPARRLLPPAVDRVCTFALTAPTGDTVTCRLRGGAPERGDLLEVYGRRGRDGVVRVREAVRVAGRTTVRGRPGAAAVLALVADGAAVLIVLACAAGLLAGTP